MQYDDAITAAQRFPSSRRRWRLVLPEKLQFLGTAVFNRVWRFAVSGGATIAYATVA